MNRAMRGVEYDKQDGWRISTPIADWSALDVLAYHAAHGLPMLRLYDFSPDAGRARGQVIFGTGAFDSAVDGDCLRAWDAAYPGFMTPWLERWPQIAAAL